MPGTATSTAEVTNISRHGFWMLVDGRELFLAFDDFPWFKQASVDAILRLERPSPQHFYWPELDVDLGLDTIETPSATRSNRRFSEQQELRLRRLLPQQRRNCADDRYGDQTHFSDRAGRRGAIPGYCVREADQSSA